MHVTIFLSNKFYEIKMIILQYIINIILVII